MAVYEIPALSEYGQLPVESSFYLGSTYNRTNDSLRKNFYCAVNEGVNGACFRLGNTSPVNIILVSWISDGKTSGLNVRYAFTSEGGSNNVRSYFANRETTINGVTYYYYSENVAGYPTYDSGSSSRYFIPSFDDYYSSLQEGLEAIFNPQPIEIPITYISISSILNGPAQANIGAEIEVDVSFPDGYKLKDATQGSGISVYNDNGYIEFTYDEATHKLRFIMPE